MNKRNKFKTIRYITHKLTGKIDGQRLKRE